MNSGDLNVMRNKFILASQSPRRREIMHILGIPFITEPADVDESAVSCDNIPPSLYVQELALYKASAAAAHHGGENNTYIIGADTIVYDSGKILGKPKDEDDAYRILRSLSGKAHSVYTGLCVIDCKSGTTVCDSCETQVVFSEISDELIRSYIASGEPMDKAGAYGIQGLGSILVKEIHGDYFNVVGLPPALLYRILKKEFGIDIMKGMID